jgi:DNA-binding NarL/FixJ family response regulator
VTGFVGRASELALLAGLGRGLAAGTGGAVLVEGEQGIGKSALLRAGLSAPGITTFWAAADELGQHFPLSLMRDVLGAAFPVLAAASVPVAAAVFAGNPVLGAAERVLEAVDRLCAAGPVLLVAEDLQWADEASVLVWHRLCRLTGQLPLLVAGSGRAGTGRADLELLRQGVSARGGTVISLGPLGASDVSLLAEPVVGGPPGRRLAGLLGHAGGNPLYARELADELVRDGRVRLAAGVADVAPATPGGSGGPAAPGQVPASLAAAVAGRLGRLPAEAYTALRWAAVLGQEFSVTDLSVVTGRSTAELITTVDTAQAAGVVTASGTRLAFRHGVCRQVLYEGMPAAVRAALHLQAAGALAAAGAAAERVAAQLAADPGAVRWAAGGWAADWLRGAAPELAFRAPQAAASLLTAALAQLPDGAPGRDELEGRLVAVSYLLGRHAEVQERGGRLIAQAAPAVAAETAWLVAYSLMQTGQAQRSGAVIRAALGAPDVDPALAARLQSLLAVSLYRLGAPAQAEAAATAGLAAAERAGEPLAAGYALHVLSLTSRSGADHDGRLRYIERALAVIGDEPRATDLRLLLLSNYVFTLIDLDRHDEAVAVVRDALVLAEQAGTPRLRQLRVAAALAYFEGGQWDEALAELEPEQDPGGGQPAQNYYPVQRHGILALIAGHRDERGTAGEHLAAVAGEDFSNHSAWGNASVLVLARALAAEQAGGAGPAGAAGAAGTAGAAGAAAAVAATALAERGGEVMPGRFLVLPTLTRLALAAGDRELAAAAAAAAAGDAAREVAPARVAHAAAHCRGLVTGDAAALLLVAAYHQACGRGPEQAAATADAAAAAAAAGDLAAARRALTAASALYAELGARWDLRAAADRLRPYGVRRGRAAGRRPAADRPGSGGWGTLTPTEVTVARQVAAGRSNSDIAAALFLSRNTVQTHVSHILGKLGVSSRAEITAVAGR